MSDKEFIRRLNSIRDFARKIVTKANSEAEFNFWVSILNGIGHVLTLIELHGIKDFNALIKEKQNE